MEKKILTKLSVLKKKLICKQNNIYLLNLLKCIGIQYALFNIIYNIVIIMYYKSFIIYVSLTCFEIKINIIMNFDLNICVINNICNILAYMGKISK